MPTQYDFPDAPKRCTQWHNTSSALVGNAVVTSIDPSEMNNVFGVQSPAVLNDEFTNGVWLRDGTYTFYVLGAKNTTHGQVDWYLDNTLILADQDWYGALTYNVIQSVAVVISNGLLYHTLKGVVNSKNASSSGYAMILTAFWFKQAAD